eukprot:gene11968-15250_t
MVLREGELMGSKPLDEERRRFRIEARDLVIGGCELMGYEQILGLSFQLIQQKLSSASAAVKQTAGFWTEIEAVLFALQAVSPFVPNDEQRVLPQLVQTLSSLPEIPQLTVTVIRLLGSLSAWMYANTSYLLPTYTYFSRCLAHRETTEASARALLDLCQAYCSTSLEFPLAELSKLVEQLRASQTLSLEADLLLLEGMSLVVSSVGKAHGVPNLKAALGTVIEPIASDLSRCIDGVGSGLGPGPGTGSHQADLLAHIDRLTTVI